MGRGLPNWLLGFFKSAVCVDARSGVRVFVCPKCLEAFRRLAENRFERVSRRSIFQQQQASQCAGSGSDSGSVFSLEWAQGLGIGPPLLS